MQWAVSSAIQCACESHNTSATDLTFSVLAAASEPLLAVQDSTAAYESGSVDGKVVCMEEEQ